jgi:hypothetical protein
VGIKVQIETIETSGSAENDGDDLVLSDGQQDAQDFSDSSDAGRVICLVEWY